MSRVPPPVVRHFIPCSGVRCDTTVSPNRYTVDDPFYAVLPPAGGYPFRAAELWLFSQITDATGLHELVVELSWDVDARFRELHRFRVELGTDRLGVRNYAVRLRRVPFARPGVYEFRLREGDETLARATVRLEEPT